MTLSESDAGQSNSVATLTIEIDRVAQEDITVEYATADGTATTIDSDYVGQSSIATISAGQTSTTIDVEIVGDDLVESDETLTVELSNVRYGDATDAESGGNQVAIQRGTGVITINDDDEALVSVSGNDDAAEADDDGQFTVRLSSPASTDTTIAYTLSGDAIAGEDFALVAGEVTILAGDSFSVVDISVLDDETLEPAETLTMTLGGITSGDPAIITLRVIPRTEPAGRSGRLSPIGRPGRSVGHRTSA